MNIQKQNQEIQVDFFETKLDKIAEQDLIKYYQNRLLLEKNSSKIEQQIKLKNISPSQIRYSLLQEFKTNQFKVLSVQKTAFQNNKKNRIKTAIIYILTAIIDGFIMFKIFHFSQWIRRIN